MTNGPLHFKHGRLKPGQWYTLRSHPLNVIQTYSLMFCHFGPQKLKRQREKEVSIPLAVPHLTLPDIGDQGSMQSDHN